MGRWRGAAVAAALVTGAAGVAPAAQAADNRPPDRPQDLRVGDRERPLEVEGAPVFAWAPQDRDGDETQSAYRLQVRQEGERGVVWDSGRVASSAQSQVTYAGPALARGESFTWRVRTWDDDGARSPWSAAARFDTGLAAEDWGASWIRRATRGEDGEFESDDYTLARAELEVGESPVVRARAYVASVHQHELYLNGRRVDRSLAVGYEDELYYQATDVTERVRAGETLAVGALYHWFDAGQGRPAVEPGLLVRVVVEHADGSVDTLVSDGSWRVTRGPWLPAERRNGEGDVIEDIDARAWPDGWDRPGFDAADWQEPEVVAPAGGEPFGLPHGLEPRLTETTVRPERVTRLPDGSTVADFGRVIPAQPVVRFAQGQAGRRIGLRVGYLLEEDGSVSTQDGTQNTDMSYGYVQRDGEQTFKPLDYLGFRYLQVGPAGEELDRDDLAAVIQHTDVDLERAAQFDSSDGTLDEVFGLMRRSLLYSAIQHFVDTPTREKGQFLHDAINISHGTMAGFRERDLTQKAIREFVWSQRRHWPDGRMNAVYPNGDGARDIPDFTEVFLEWVHRYWLETGDRSLTEFAYPAMRDISEYVTRHIDPATGLVTNLTGGSGPYQFGIVDWPAAGRFGYDMETSVRTTVNALAVDALRRTAEVGRALGRPTAETEALAARAGALEEAIDARLRRADGTYVDGLKADGSQSTGTSQHAGAYALAYGLVPEEDVERVAEDVASRGMRMGPMTAHRLLEGLARAGRVDAVLRLLTNEDDFGWANVLARGGTFTWESWDARERNESESHGWGAMALIDVQDTLLGVRVTEPGAERVAVEPPSDPPLRRASGTLPTERGTVEVAWRDRRAGVALEVDVPVNVRATVTLPLEGVRRYVARGEGAPRLVAVRDGRAVYEVGSGTTGFTPRPR